MNSCGISYFSLILNKLKPIHLHRFDSVQITSYFHFHISSKSYSNKISFFLVSVDALLYNSNPFHQSYFLPLSSFVRSREFDGLRGGYIVCYFVFSCYLRYCYPSSLDLFVHFCILSLKLLLGAFKDN